jgi:hypothetical protein
VCRALGFVSGSFRLPSFEIRERVLIPNDLAVWRSQRLGFVFSIVVDSKALLRFVFGFRAIPGGGLPSPRVCGLLARPRRPLNPAPDRTGYADGFSGFSSRGEEHRPATLEGSPCVDACPRTPFIILSPTPSLGFRRSVGSCTARKRRGKPLHSAVYSSLDGGYGRVRTVGFRIAGARSTLIPVASVPPATRNDET